MKLTQTQKALRSHANSQQATSLRRFFKTGPGEYGENDLFIGVKVPNIRLVAKTYRDNISNDELDALIHSPIHEDRMLALIVLIWRFETTQEHDRKQIYKYYLDNLNFINNWDLVDISAPRIVGGYLFSKSRKPLYRLAHAKNIWERRIAIVATFYFIKNNDLKDACAIAKILLTDSHDLIHKAVGWALREVGKKDKQMLEQFLIKNYDCLSRTTLRYSIEKFQLQERKKFLALNKQ